MAAIDLSLKPTILVVVTKDINEEALKPIFHGMEEEGIPYIYEKRTGISVKQAAFDAANTSSLSVGVACDGEQIILQYKNLSLDNPFLVLNDFTSLHKQKIKNFGSNSARLVKGIALKQL